MGGDVEGALEGINVPAYMIDQTGVIRWTNRAAQRCLGADVRGRQFTSVVAPEDTRRAARCSPRRSRERRRDDAEVVLVDANGRRAPSKSARCRCSAATG